MTAHTSYYLRISLLALAVALLVTCLGIPGCRGGEDGGIVEDLFIRRYRCNIDENHGVVRVVGEVENKGKQPVAEVEVRAIPRSPSGSRRGENMTVLRNIKPGERRTFSLTVTSHGRAASVQLELTKPAAPP